MKKYSIIGLLIVVAVLVYFLCSGPEKVAEKETNTSLLTDTTIDKSETTRTYDAGDDESSRSDDSSGAREAETAPAAEDTASFTLQGESGVFTYRAVAGFRKISPTPEISGYVTNFAFNMAGINISDQKSYNHVISILLPGDVAPGEYNEKSNPFIFQFFGTENGRIYTLNFQHQFTLTVDEWGGPGKRARGTFAGELKSGEGEEIITIRNGKFDVGIQ